MITTMKSMAQQGGGSYYAATNIRSFPTPSRTSSPKSRAVNSVFRFGVAAGQREHAGDVPEPGVTSECSDPMPAGSPKWLGNVKQYQLKYDTTTGAVRLADADGLDAIDAGTGFVSVLARSYWTTSSTFWTNWVPGKTATASDSKDGPEVHKGGAAQRQREANLTTQASRPVYTCAVDATTGAPACVGNALLSATPFNTTTLNPADRGHAEGAQLSGGLDVADNARGTDIGNLIAWARGNDNLGNESGPGGTTTVRPTIHGDVLHSRPVALNYGGSPPRVVVFLWFQRRHASRDRRQADRHRGRQRIVGVRRPGNPGEAEPFARRNAEAGHAFEPCGQPEQQGLLPGRADRRVPGGRDGDHLRGGASRRQLHLRVRRQQPGRAQVQVQALPEHHGLERPGPDLVDAQSDQGARRHRLRKSGADLRWRLRHCRGLRQPPARRGAASTSWTR